MNCLQHVSVPTALFAAVLSGCAATRAGDQPAIAVAAQAQAGSGMLLPTPSGPLDISAAQGGELTLADVLSKLSKTTGVTFSSSDTVGERLKKTKVMLSADKRVAVAEIYPWAESILQQNGFTLALLEGGPAPLVGVYANTGRDQSPPALHIEESRIDECREHPAFLFNVVVTLPHTDVRSLGNSLRILSPDSPTGGVIPVGTTNSVILSGSGRQVAELCAMLHTIDDRAALGAIGV